MTKKYHFKIYRHCPKEMIFDGEMTFTEARKFMDENASEERRVACEVYNDAVPRWEKSDLTYHGGRRVYGRKGGLYIIDPDYRNMWKPESQRYHLWCVFPDGSRLFVLSTGTEEQACIARDNMQRGRNECRYVVEPSDIPADVL